MVLIVVDGKLFSNSKQVMCMWCWKKKLFPHPKEVLHGGEGIRNKEESKIIVRKVILEIF